MKYFVDSARTKSLKSAHKENGKTQVDTISSNEKDWKEYVENTLPKSIFHFEGGGGFEKWAQIVFDSKRFVKKCTGKKVKSLADKLGIDRSRMSEEHDDEESAKLLLRLEENQPDVFYFWSQ